MMVCIVCKAGAWHGRQRVGIAELGVWVLSLDPQRFDKSDTHIVLKGIYKKQSHQFQPVSGYTQFSFLLVFPAFKLQFSKIWVVGSATGVTVFHI